jgi:hypothetical protein
MAAITDLHLLYEPAVEFQWYIHQTHFTTSRGHI